MDRRFVELAERADFVASIIGNPATQQYILLDCHAPAPPEAGPLVLRYRMDYLGVIGMVEGVPRMVLKAPLDADSIALLTDSFVQRVAAATMPLRLVAEVEKPEDDFVRFAEQLFGLPDTRN